MRHGRRRAGRGPSAADESASTEVVVWNTLSRVLFDRLELGDLVCILGYRVKRSYSKPGGVEVAVNPRNPPGQIVRLTRTSLRRISVGSRRHRGFD